MKKGHRLRQIVNVLDLATPLGVLIAWTSGSRLSRGPRGLIIAAGYGWSLPYAGAFTMGNVVLFRAPSGTAGNDPVLLGHEEKHCTQYAYCLGLPFLLLYALCAGWSMLRSGNPASRNFFERQAGLAAGGYIDPGGRFQDLPSPKRNEA